MKRKPLYFMTDDGGTGNGAGEGSGDGGAGGAAGKADDGAGRSGAGTDEGKTFTQADVDRIIAGRLTKFADYDTVKQQLADVQTANQTESEKALGAAKDEGRREGATESGKLVALEAFNGLAGRRNPEYDTAPALNLIDLGKFLKDDGTLDRDALKAAVEQIVPEKDATKPAPSFGGGARRTPDKAEPAPGVARLRQAYADTAK